MKLEELADATGTGPSILKFYLREGLLFPGVHVQDDGAEYGQAHADRVEMVRVLNSVAGLDLSQVKRIVRAIGHGNRLEALALVQELVMGLDTAPVPPSPLGAEVAARHGWLPAGTPARNALDAQLESMAALGLEPTPEEAEVYARAADEVAVHDLEGFVEAGAESLDRLVTRAATAMHLHTQLLLKMLAVAHASHSARLLAPGPEDGDGTVGVPGDGTSR